MPRARYKPSISNNKSPSQRSALFSPIKLPAHSRTARVGLLELFTALEISVRQPSRRKSHFRACRRVISTSFFRANLFVRIFVGAMATAAAAAAIIVVVVVVVESLADSTHDGAKPRTFELLNFFFTLFFLSEKIFSFEKVNCKRHNFTYCQWHRKKDVKPRCIIFLYTYNVNGRIQF